jgi:hypothetical protein
MEDGRRLMADGRWKRDDGRGKKNRLLNKIIK